MTLIIDVQGLVRTKAKFIRWLLTSLSEKWTRSKYLLRWTEERYECKTVQRSEREKKSDYQWVHKRQSERRAKQEIGRFRLVSAPSVGSLGQIFGYMGVEQYSIQDCTHSQCKLQLFAARGRLVIRCTTIFRNIPTAPSAENPERPTTRPGRDRIKYE